MYAIYTIPVAYYLFAICTILVVYYIICVLKPRPQASSHGFAATGWEPVAEVFRYLSFDIICKLKALFRYTVNYYKSKSLQKWCPDCII